MFRFSITKERTKGNIIIFDFEVFKYDVLLGALVLNKNNISCYQTWDKNEIKNFYLDNINAVWFGHNNKAYDNFILQAVIDGKNVYDVSKMLIKYEDNSPLRLHINLHYIDLMKMTGSKCPFYSLKMTEAASGKNISESEVSFDLDRPLTKEEKALTESYNRDDLNQTYDNFVALKNEWLIRFKLCKEFNLDISHVMDTEGMLGASVLGCHKIKGIENQYKAPLWYEDLRMNTQPIVQFKHEKGVTFTQSDLKSFYLNEEFKKDMGFNLNICGGTINGGSGGMHSALSKYHCENALYFDVSGFYNLIMINKDLLPRGLDDNGKQRYVHCYEEQLRLKKINPIMRGVYKKVLLAVFGGMGNNYTEFYDPYNFDLVMITGQLYIVDLLQKLQGKINLVQINTDGIIVEPLDWNNRQEIIKIVEEWESRTGFVIKKVPIHNIWQRDVNNYIFTNEDGSIETKGEYGLYNAWDNIFTRQTWGIKEPPIFATAIVEFVINGIAPEETIEKNKRRLRMFQYLCKKGGFKSMEYEVRDESNRLIKKETLQNVNRCFPYNSLTEVGKIFKVRPDKRCKYPCLPDNVFIYNDDINEECHIDDIIDRIDWQYYVDKTYKKLTELVSID